MKVSLINTRDSGGGAAVACSRLMKALTHKGVSAKMLVQHKNTNSSNVEDIADSCFNKLAISYNFLAERLPFILKEKDRAVRFAFSTANTGTDISRRPLIRHADILHLHWVNSGFLSLKNLKELAALNIPIVWTLHDMWAFTGGCHYSGICDHFTHQCGNCYFLKRPSDKDLSHRGWLEKQELYKFTEKITFIACSEWLAGIARQSSLLRDFRIEAIPNPIDTTQYTAKNKAEIRNKLGIAKHTSVILFGAANINDRRKGVSYFIEALNRMKQNNSDADICVVLFGKNKTLDSDSLPFPTISLPVIGFAEDLVEIYSAADVFVLPSLEDNLPNTVMEALSCAVPVVAFNQGGLSEMIEHKVNGYLAAYKSAEDIAEGIEWVLEANKNGSLSLNARNKVTDNFNEELVASRYMDVYQSILLS